MKTRSCTFLLVAVVVGIISPFSHAADDPAKKKERAKGPRPEEDTSTVRATRAADKVVTFKQTPQGDLQAHIFFPPGWSARDQRPAIVFWVGGGFRSGKVGQFLSRSEYFASRGLVTICAEYRGRFRLGDDLNIHDVPLHTEIKHGRRKKVSRERCFARACPRRSRSRSTSKHAASSASTISAGRSISTRCVTRSRRC